MGNHSTAFQRLSDSPLLHTSGNSYFLFEMMETLQSLQGDQEKTPVLVNNRSEGNAPLTLQALTDHLLEAQI